MSGFPAEGWLDRCWITSTPQTHHSGIRTETGREGERKEEEEAAAAVTDERRDKWRKKRRRGIGREHMQREKVWGERVRGREGMKSWK